jgi:hypothetical protein
MSKKKKDPVIEDYEKLKISHLIWSRSLSGQYRSFVGFGLFP